MKEINNIADWLGNAIPSNTKIVERKYIHTKEITGKKHDETIHEFLQRISLNDPRYYELISESCFIPGGRILANLGLTIYGIKCTYSNCYVIEGPDDSIESIWDTAKYIARTFSYGGGVGIDISRLAPDGAIVRNTANESTGAVSFIEIFAETARAIGQKNRRGALMICINDTHPDLEEFISNKSDLEKATTANLSVKISDAFFESLNKELEYRGVTLEEKITPRENWKLSFTREETGQVIEKNVSPNYIMDLIAKTAWDYAEPGILYWDTINRNSLMGADPYFQYEATNPCGELPLPNGGACLLGAMNLSKYFDIGNSYFNDDLQLCYDKKPIKKFEKDIHTAIEYLDEVLTLNENLHPLEVQRETVRNYRAIGLGIMGLSDVFVQCGIKYGSEESIKLSDMIGSIMAFNAIEASCNLAKKKGSFLKCNPSYIIESEFFIRNVKDNNYIDIPRRNSLIDRVMLYGLRNAQLLTVAPTGTTSTILNVSGGIEPIFSNHYTRTTKTIDKNGDMSYDVYPKVVTEYAKENPLNMYTSNDKIIIENLPDYFVTAKDVHYKDKIAVQATWQKHIDNAISSTVNLPEETTVDEIKDLYIHAHKMGLKGITVYRESCKRGGILEDKSKKKKEDKKATSTTTSVTTNIGNIVSDRINNGNIVWPVTETTKKNEENIKGIGTQELLSPICINKTTDMVRDKRIENNRKDYGDLSEKERNYILKRVEDLKEEKQELEDEINRMKKKEEEKKKIITRKELGKRLDAAVYYITIACGHIYVVISRDENNKPVEIFMQSSKSGGCSANTESLGRFASACLRSGMDIDTVVDIAKGVKCPACTNLKGKGQKIDGLSCADAMVRVLKDEWELQKQLEEERKTKIYVNKCDDKKEVDHKYIDPHFGVPIEFKNPVNTGYIGKFSLDAHSDQIDRNLVKEPIYIKDAQKIEPKSPEIIDFYKDWESRDLDCSGGCDNCSNNCLGDNLDLEEEDPVWDYTQHTEQENIDNYICPECGTMLQRTEGCMKCIDCGFSKC